MATWRAPRGLCAKCDSGYATHFYHEAGDCIGRRNRRDDEHLHYVCSRCGYDWCVDVYVPHPEEPVWTWWAVSAAVGFGLLFIVAVIVVVLLIITHA